jgi:hypothetical protein
MTPTQAQIDKWPNTADAAQWAAEFRKTAINLGYSDMDEGWLIGWFANAIENAEIMRHPALTAAAQAGEEHIEYLRQANRELGAVANGIKDEAIERCAQVAKKYIEDLTDSKSPTMSHWDEIRAQCLRYKGSDLPRLNFESLIETIAENTEAAILVLKDKPDATNERLRCTIAEIKDEP